MAGPTAAAAGRGASHVGRSAMSLMPDDLAAGSCAGGARRRKSVPQLRHGVTARTAVGAAAVAPAIGGKRIDSRPRLGLADRSVLAGVCAWRISAACSLAAKAQRPNTIRQPVSHA